MKIINMTPHPVVIMDTDRSIIRTYQPSGKLIRLESKTERGPLLEDGTPTSYSVFGDPIGLPDQKSGILYIVSRMVLSALPDRDDLLVPNEVIRDDDGKIIGCQSLATS